MEQIMPLGKVLQAKGILTQQKVEHYQQQAHQCQVSFVQYLIDNNLLGAHIIFETISQLTGAPRLDLAYLDTEHIPTDLIDEKDVRQYTVLPIYKENDLLYLAMVDPCDQRAIKEIKFKTGLNILPVIVDSTALSRVIKYILSKKNEMTFQQFKQNLPTSTVMSKFQFINQRIHTIDNNDQQEPLVNFINKVISEAINQAASDIHFEPFEHMYRVRYRVDGELNPVISLPLEQAKPITNRLKVLAELDIAEHRLPQDGRFKIKFTNHHAIDLRMSTCPTIYGEKIVVRILNHNAHQLNIEHLGMNALQRRQFYQSIQKNQGMVIVTGPTGSGKTTTLYAAINYLNTAEKNILTVEDPVEIKLTGVNQVQVNSKINLNFSKILRAFLRQDPDIIMIGEIRDFETAEIAVKAAQTGHLVFSTLHTNSAAAAIIRLQNLGIFPYNITSSVSLIIAQQLVRKLCQHCKRPTKYSETELLQHGLKGVDLGSLNLFKAGDCQYCKNGYHGRLGLFEIMPLSADIKTLIMEAVSMETLEMKAIQNGMITIRQSGLAYFKQGIISLEELNRVTNTI